MIALRVVLVHLYQVWRSGQARFRMETYGLYYPARPYERPVWRVNPRVAIMLLRQLPSYGRWVRRLDAIRTVGGGAWWRDEGYQVGEVLDEWNR